MCPQWNAAKSQSLKAQQDEVIVSDNTHTKVYLARSGMRVRNASVGSVSPLRCTLAAHILGTLAATAAAAAPLFVKTWFPTRTSSVGRFPCQHRHRLVNSCSCWCSRTKTNNRTTIVAIPTICQKSSHLCSKDHRQLHPCAADCQRYHRLECLPNPEPRS